DDECEGAIVLEQETNRSSSTVEDDECEGAIVLEQETNRSSSTVEDDECEGAIVLEQETNRSSSTIGRYFANNLVRAPIFLSFLSMLGSTAGAKTNSLASTHCNLSSIICSMISSNYSGLVNETIGMAFNNFLTNPKFKLGKLKAPINNTIPISVIIDGGSARGFSRQLSSMYEYIGDLHNAFIGDDDIAGSSYCAKNLGNFCNKNYHRNISYYESCCPDIESYIRNITYVLPTTSAPTENLITDNTTVSSVTDGLTDLISANPTTTSLADIFSTISPTNLTTTVTTIFNEGNKGSLSTVIFVVVLFFVGVVLLFVAYMGFRSGRRRGVYHVGGSGEESRPVYMRDNIEEHLEEDEEESRTVSRPVYVGEDIEEHSI
ncbi:hypothetical protein, partial [Candidatus Ichthyocystis sparus]|uniref:hypothetical protein n=1 Tax=Candidatus Ichthyocystis sparus TaxID=1561004 RepID=UPI00159EE756